MKLHKIKDNLFCIQTGPIGTNTYFFGTKPILVIDPGYGIGSFIKDECIVLLTHGHFDHMCGLNELKVQKVFISSEDASALKNPMQNLSPLFSTKFVYNQENCEILTQEKLEIAGLSILILSTPGHTPGSLIYKVDGMWFTGDTIFLETIGRTDLPGSDEKAMTKTINWLSKILRETDKNEIILPGHMDWGTVEETLLRNSFLAEEVP